MGCAYRDKKVVGVFVRFRAASVDIETNANVVSFALDFTS
jgi:hypothetical protein